MIVNSQNRMCIVRTHVLDISAKKIRTSNEVSIYSLISTVFCKQLLVYFFCYESLCIHLLIGIMNEEHLGPIK